MGEFLCIYCKAERYSPQRIALGEEHIIPEHLGGTDVIDQAACAYCEETINKIETFLANSTFEALRIQQGIRGKRRRSPLLKSIKASFFKDARWIKQKVPASEAPVTLMLPVLPQPTLLYKQPLPLSNVVQFCILKTWDDAQMKRVCMNQGAKAWRYRSKPINPMVFARFLAKVGHCACAREVGRWNFHPLVLPFIEGAPQFPSSRLIGGTGQFDGGDDGRHYSKVEKVSVCGKRFYVVRIGVFRDLGFPEYICIAGQHIDDDPIKLPPITPDEMRPWRLPLRREEPEKIAGYPMDQELFLHPGNYDAWLDARYEIEFGGSAE